MFHSLPLRPRDYRGCFEIKKKKSWVVNDMVLHHQFQSWDNVENGGREMPVIRSKQIYIGGLSDLQAVEQRMPHYRSSAKSCTRSDTVAALPPIQQAGCYIRFCHAKAQSTLTAHTGFQLMLTKANQNAVRVNWLALLTTNSSSTSVDALDVISWMSKAPIAQFIHPQHVGSRTRRVPLMV